jgi:hypothetical protein
MKRSTPDPSDAYVRDQSEHERQLHNLARVLGQLVARRWRQLHAGQEPNRPTPIRTNRKKHKKERK